MREWASGMHTGSPEGDWQKMQDEFSEYIVSWKSSKDRRPLIDIYIDRIE